MKPRLTRTMLVAVLLFSAAASAQTVKPMGNPKLVPPPVTRPATAKTPATSTASAPAAATHRRHAPASKAKPAEPNTDTKLIPDMRPKPAHPPAQQPPPPSYI